MSSTEPTSVDYDADSYTLSTTGVGTAAADLLLDGAGTAGPLTPDNYLQRIVQLSLSNTATVAGYVTIQASTGGTSPTVRKLGSFNVAASSTLVLNEEMVRYIAQYNYKFQAIASTGTFDVYATAILTKGAGR